MLITRTRTVVGLALLGLSVACALMLAREEGRRRARAKNHQRDLQDWESEGGALATQPQIPGTTAATVSAAHAETP